MGSKDKRQLVDNLKQQRMIHSLESCNYLKVDKSNYLLFACAKYSDRQVQIQQEYSIKKAKNQSNQEGEKEGEEEFDETEFEKIYNIKIWEITLRELLLF